MSIKGRRVCPRCRRSLGQCKPPVADQFWECMNCGWHFQRAKVLVAAAKEEPKP